jgi:hypothetical protein
MDETDGWLVTLSLAALTLASILLAHAVRGLQQDMELLRMTAAVPLPERGI